MQDSTHIVKTGRLDFSLSWLNDEVRENLGDLRTSIQILTFLSPLPHVLLPFTKTNVLHYDLKKDVWNKILNIKPCMGHISRSWEYVNIEEKVWLLVKKIRTWKDWLKLRFLTEIGRLHWNQGEEVAHFAWFGESWWGFHSFSISITN